MWRVLFLILVLTSSTAFPQARESKPQASNVDAFGPAANGDIKARLDAFFVELMNDPTAQGHIITYGPNRQVAARERLIKNQIYFRRFDSQKITFVTGGFSKEIKTEFWVVPQGAEPPKLAPAAKIFAEIGRATNQKFKKLFEKFYNAPEMESTATAYIINYGNTSNTAVREKQIRNNIGRGCDFGCPRLVIVNGGKAKALKTVFWIVPEGAEPPTP